MEPLKILHLEDNQNDAEIVKRLLKKEHRSFEYQLCMTKQQYIDALEKFDPDVILADNALPQFDAAEAMTIANQHLLHIPFILVTGTISEEFAVDMIKRGADDYILKDRLGRLAAAIDAAVKNRNATKEKATAILQLEESEEKYRMLVEQAFDSIIIYSPGGNILDCNVSACHQTGYTASELKSLTVFDLFAAEALSARPLYFKTLMEGQSTLDYRKLKRKDGSSAEMEIGTKMLPNGNMMAIGRDITERKKAQEKLEQSEKRFRALVENNEGIISLLDKNMITLFRSSSAARITGWSHPEFEQVDAKDYIHPDDMGAMLNVVNKVVNNPGRPVTFEVRVKHKQGHYISLEGVMTNLLNDPAVKGIVSNMRDITERKKAEEILNEERDKFTRIAATSPGLIYSFRQAPDGSFSFPYTSSAVEGLFGFKHEEITNNINKIFSLSYPEDVEHVLKNISESAATLQPWKDEFRYRHPLKGEICLEGHSIPIKEPDGGILWQGIIMDVTERKKAAQKIIQSELNLKAIFENTSEGFVLIDANGIVKAFNERASKSIFINMDGDIYPGKSIYDFVERERMDFFRTVITQVMKGKMIQYDRSFKGRDGITTWINFTVNPVRTDGTVAGVCITGRDITEKKRAEDELTQSFVEKNTFADRLFTILNTLPANIVLLDERGIIVDVNEAWKNFADANGFNGENYGIGEDYVKFSHDKVLDDETDEKKVARGIQSVLTGQLDEFVTEYPCHSPNVKRWFRMMVTRIRGAKKAGAVVMHVDISELRKLEQERMQSKIAEQKNITKAMIQGQEKERNAIGRELHDNVNQILAGINLLLGMLKTKPERLQEYLTLCIEHIQLAINENRKIAHELVSPNEVADTLIAQVEKICRTMLQNAGLTTIVLHDQFNESLLTDDQKLAVYRIIQEQCSNIIKYAQASNVEFMLSTREENLHLEIKDDGKGMKKDKPVEGIGLQNMKSRISVLNGKLKIDTAPGKGFLLEVEIPI